MNQPTVFISYSHRDEVEKDELIAHLGVLKHAGLIDTWSDDCIDAGSDWQTSIQHAIDNARVAIMLVTANFLNSEFTLRAEVPQLLKRRQQEGLIVVPIISRACAWRAVPWLRELQVFPRNGIPVWSNGGNQVDENLSTIAEYILSLVHADANLQFRSPKVKRSRSSTTTLGTIPPPTAPVACQARLWQVLSVDDEPSWQKRLVRILREVNCNVVTANSFEEAITALREMNFDLITVDLNLDKSTSYADGLELVPRIRELFGQQVPVIVITGTGGLDEQRRAFKEYNVFDFIQKAKLDFEEVQYVAIEAIGSAHGLVQQTQKNLEFDGMIT